MSKKPNIDTLTNEFDYNLLKSALKDYLHPRVKINQLLKTQKITRVKKGIYVKSGEDYSPLVLANMIYGPSYVSQDFALSLYNLIPERVVTVTCMTLGRNKEFHTPCGLFSYEHLDPNLYSLGIRRVEIEYGRAYLMASPEKALIDRLQNIKGLDTVQRLEDYLESDMRFDFSNIQQIKLHDLSRLVKVYNRSILFLLEELLRNKKDKTKNDKRKAS
jgi:hypothetical protein